MPAVQSLAPAFFQSYHPFQMTTEEFRQLALSFPETEERSHMDHPDFRIVGGKIFATIAPDGERGMAKLTSELQEWFVRTEPNVFEPASGAWGRGGATMIDLKEADESTIRQALSAAWRNTAPKKVVERFDREL
jgi:hypothetical protein